MDIKKAIMTAVIWYALVFFIASVLMFTFSLTGTLFGIATVVLSAIAGYLLIKYYYFKGMKVKDPVKHGLQLGITILVISFLIEIPVMVYGFAAEQGWSFFIQWNVILGYLIALILPVIVAYQAR